MPNAASEVLRLLEVMCRHSRPVGISELSDLLLEAKSLVFNRIKALEDEGYVEQDPHSKQYFLTTKLLELTNSSLSRYYSRTNIHTYLKAIGAHTGQCTYFGLRNRQNRVVYVDRYVTEGVMTVYTNIGDSPMPHCTAHGKALLAFLSLEDIERIIECGLEKFTESTISDKARLVEELRAIRQLGYALDREERTEGVRCAAAPVFNSYKEVVGAIGFSGMAQQLPYALLEEYARFVKEVAEKVSITIGNDIVF